MKYSAAGKKMGLFGEGFSTRMWSELGWKGEQHWYFKESGATLHDAVTIHAKTLEQVSNFSTGELTYFITS